MRLSTAVMWCWFAFAGIGGHAKRVQENWQGLICNCLEGPRRETLGYEIAGRRICIMTNLILIFQNCLCTCIITVIFGIVYGLLLVFLFMDYSEWLFCVKNVYHTESNWFVDRRTRVGGHQGPGSQRAGPKPGLSQAAVGFFVFQYCLITKKWWNGHIKLQTSPNMV